MFDLTLDVLRCEWLVHRVCCIQSRYDCLLDLRTREARHGIGQRPDIEFAQSLIAPAQVDRQDGRADGGMR